MRLSVCEAQGQESNNTKFLLDFMIFTPKNEELIQVKVNAWDGVALAKTKRCKFRGGTVLMVGVSWLLLSFSKFNFFSIGDIFILGSFFNLVEYDFRNNNT